MKLFGHYESGHAYKVKLCLAVANLPHEYEEVDIILPREERSAEFRRHARFSEVPLLLDDNKAYVQSNAILLHLAEKHDILGAEDSSSFKLCKEWLFWEANKIGMCLPQLRLARKFKDPDLNAETQRWLAARYDHDIGLLNEELSDHREFIIGDAPTIADFSLCGYLFFADEAEVEVPPHVKAWLKRISALDGWKHPYDLMKTSA